MPPNSINLIFSPYHVDTQDHRVSNGPHRIRRLGVIKGLERLSLDVQNAVLDPVEDF